MARYPCKHIVRGTYQGYLFLQVSKGDRLGTPTRYPRRGRRPETVQPTLLKVVHPKLAGYFGWELAAFGGNGETTFALTDLRGPEPNGAGTAAPNYAISTQGFFPS
jgi:hypothetical protein